jgi:hypothetical protein
VQLAGDKEGRTVARWARSGEHEGTVARSDQQLDDLIAFILAASGRDEEWMRRSLGMIHLIKYAYLADLFESEAGHTSFTGANWTFFHFGPWDAGLLERIEASLYRLGAEQIEVASKYGDDRRLWRWSRDLEPYEEIRERLPRTIRVRLPRDIHDFANDTASLLDRVYKTKPMLYAAPREALSFVAEPRPAVYEAVRPATDEEEGPQQSARKRQKKLQRAKAALAERLKAWREERGEEAATFKVEPAPRYDDVFSAGAEWLDSLAGEPLAPSDGVLAVDDGVWHSLARRGGDGG